jgi:hypothetical protein
MMAECFWRGITTIASVGKVGSSRNRLGSGCAERLARCCRYLACTDQKERVDGGWEARGYRLHTSETCISMGTPIDGYEAIVLRYSRPKTLLPET